MFPIVIMCVMPWVMQMEVKNIVVDVVDIDHTVESQRLVQQIAASNYFIFGGQKSTLPPTTLFLADRNPPTLKQ